MPDRTTELATLGATCRAAPTGVSALAIAAIGSLGRDVVIRSAVRAAHRWRSERRCSEALALGARKIKRQLADGRAALGVVVGPGQPAVTTRPNGCGVTLDKLAAAAGWTGEARRGFLRVARELLVETARLDGNAEYRLHHDSIREHIVHAI